MRYVEKSSIKYQSQTPNFIRRLKGENVNGSYCNDDDQEFDEFGRTTSYRDDKGNDGSESESEKDPIKELLKDGAQIEEFIDDSKGWFRFSLHIYVYSSIDIILIQISRKAIIIMIVVIVVIIILLT